MKAGVGGEVEHEMEPSPQGKEHNSSGNTREPLRGMQAKEEINGKIFDFVGTGV